MYDLKGREEDDVAVDREKCEKGKLSAAGVMKWKLPKDTQRTGNNLKASVKVHI